MCSFWTGVSVIHAFWESLQGVYQRYNQCVMQWPAFREGWRSSWASNICTLQIVQLKEQAKYKCMDSLTGCFPLDIKLRPSQRMRDIISYCQYLEPLIPRLAAVCFEQESNYRNIISFIYPSTRVLWTVFLLIRRLLFQDKL